MGSFKVSTPAPGYAGMVGSVQFADGVAVMDSDSHAAELAYVTAAGYTVEPVGVDEPAVVEDVDGDGVVETLPKKSASAEEWRKFATAHGVPQDEADSLSRDQLVARFIKEDSK